MKSVKLTEIPPLTGLRGIAAYSVLFAHALNFMGELALPLANLGFFAMSLFFTLSGFVIHYNYGRRFAHYGYVSATRQFLLARFARLYPLYFVGLIVLGSTRPRGIFFTNPWAALSCLTLSQSWFNAQWAVGSMFGASWSISTEFGLYLMYIPVAASICRLRRPLPALVCFCIVAPCTILTWRSLYSGLPRQPVASSAR